MHFPPKFLQKRFPLYFFRGAFAPSFIWSRRPCVTSPASSSYFSRTVLRRTGLVRRSWTRDSCFRLAGFVTAEQPRPQSNWLQNLGPDSATSLPDETAERGRSETASDWRVERNGTRRYWRRYSRVAQMSPCMCSGQTRTLWIFSDLLISLICPWIFVDNIHH